MMKRRPIYTIAVFIFCLISLQSQAQNERKYIREGNKLFKEALSDTSKVDTSVFSQAETDYRRALNKRPDDQKWNFNLGDALYKQQKYKDAEEKFESIAKNSNDKLEKAKAYHNLGNSLLMQKKIDASIKSYQKALLNNPSDMDTKYNLLYAMNLKKKQQKQKKQQNKNNKKNKDNKDKQNQKNKQNQQKKQKKQNQKNQKNNQKQNPNNQKQKQQNKPQPQQQKISKASAERLLNALQNDEEKVQKKLKKAQAAKVKERSSDKNW